MVTIFLMAFYDIINENLNKCKLNKNIRIRFNPKEKSLNNFFETIKSFGNLYCNSFQFRECPNNINENMKYTISGDNKNIVIAEKNVMMGVLCVNELDKAIEEHKWKIKILKTQSKRINIGIAPIDFDFNSDDPYYNGWYLYCYDLTLWSGPPQNYSDKNSGLSKINDEIIVIMNMKKKALKFIINNEDKGDSYTNIPIDKPLFPAVLLKHQGDSVEIIEC